MKARAINPRKPHELTKAERRFRNGNGSSITLHGDDTKRSRLSWAKHDTRLIFRAQT